MDKDLQELHKLYTERGNTETFDQFIDAKNQMGDDVFYNYIYSQIPSVKKKDNSQSAPLNPTPGEGDPNIPLSVPISNDLQLNPAQQQTIQSLQAENLSASSATTPQPISTDLPATETASSGTENSDLGQAPIINQLPPKVSPILPTQNKVKTQNDVLDKLAGTGEVAKPLIKTVENVVGVWQNADDLAPKLNEKYGGKPIIKENGNEFVDFGNGIVLNKSLLPNVKTAEEKKKDDEFIKENTAKYYGNKLEEFNPEKPKWIDKSIGNISGEYYINSILKQEKEGKVKVARNSAGQLIDKDQNIINDNSNILWQPTGSYINEYNAEIKNFNLQVEDKNTESARSNLYASFDKKEAPKSEMQQLANSYYDATGKLADTDFYNSLSTPEGIKIAQNDIDARNIMKESPKLSYDEALAQATEKNKDKNVNIYQSNAKFVAGNFLQNSLSSQNPGDGNDHTTRLENAQDEDELNFYRQIYNNPTDQLSINFGKWWDKEGQWRYGTSEYLVNKTAKNQGDRRTILNDFLNWNTKDLRIQSEANSYNLNNKKQQLLNAANSGDAENVANLNPEIVNLSNNARNLNTQAEEAKNTQGTINSIFTTANKIDQEKSDFNAKVLSGDAVARTQNILANAVFGVADTFKEVALGTERFVTMFSDNKNISDELNYATEHDNFNIGGATGKQISSQVTDYTDPKNKELKYKKVDGQLYSVDKNDNYTPVRGLDESKLDEGKSYQSTNASGVIRGITKFASILPFADGLGGVVLESFSNGAAYLSSFYNTAKSAKNIITVAEDFSKLNNFRKLSAKGILFDEAAATNMAEISSKYFGEESVIANNARKYSKFLNNPQSRNFTGFYLDMTNSNHIAGEKAGLKGANLELYKGITNTTFGLLMALNPLNKILEAGSSSGMSNIVQSLLKGEVSTAKILTNDFFTSLYKSAGQGVKFQAEMQGVGFVDRIVNRIFNTTTGSTLEIEDKETGKEKVLGILPVFAMGMLGFAKNIGGIKEFANMSKPEIYTELARDKNIIGALNDYKNNQLYFGKTNEVITEAATQIATIQKYINLIPNAEKHSNAAVFNVSNLIQKIEKKENDIKTSHPTFHDQLKSDISDLQKEIEVTLANDVNRPIYNFKENKRIDLNAKTGEEVYKTEASVEPVGNQEFKDFTDSGSVAPERLQSIAEKVKTNSPLSEYEQAIFNDKTPEINQILQDNGNKQNPQSSTESIREQGANSQMQEDGQSIEEGGNNPNVELPVVEGEYRESEQVAQADQEVEGDLKPLESIKRPIRSREEIASTNKNDIASIQEKKNIFGKPTGVVTFTKNGEEYTVGSKKDPKGREYAAWIINREVQDDNISSEVANNTTEELESKIAKLEEEYDDSLSNFSTLYIKNKNKFSKGEREILRDENRNEKEILESALKIKNQNNETAQDKPQSEQPKSGIEPTKTAEQPTNLPNEGSETTVPNVQGEVNDQEPKQAAEADKEVNTKPVSEDWRFKNGEREIKVSDINNSRNGGDMSLEEATERVKEGQVSQTEGNPYIARSENGKFDVVDGYHRIAEGIVKGVKTIKANVENSIQIRDALYDGKYQKAIASGEMTPKEAVDIIKSADFSGVKLEVPKEIESLLNKQPTDQTNQNEKTNIQQQGLTEVNQQPTNQADDKARENDNDTPPEVLTEDEQRKKSLARLQEISDQMDNGTFKPKNAEAESLPATPEETPNETNNNPTGAEIKPENSEKSNEITAADGKQFYQKPDGNWYGTTAKGTESKVTRKNRISELENITKEKNVVLTKEKNGFTYKKYKNGSEEIISSKGQIINSETERTVKGKKKTITNPQFANQKAKIFGEKTANQINKEDTARRREALMNFVPSNAREAALLYFAGGGKISAEEISKRVLGNSKRLEEKGREKRLLTDYKWAFLGEKARTFDNAQMAIREEAPYLDEQDVTNELIDAVNSYSSSTDIAEEIVDLYNKSTDPYYGFTDADIIAMQEADMTAQQLALVDSVADTKDNFSDAQLFDYYKDQYENSIQSLTKEQQDELYQSTEPNAGTNSPKSDKVESIQSSNEQPAAESASETGKQEVSSPEYQQLLKEKTAKELQVKSLKDNLDQVSKKTNQNFQNDQQDLFGERPSDNANVLFDERADGEAGKTVIAEAKSKYDAAKSELSGINEQLKSFENGNLVGTSSIQFRIADEKNMVALHNISEKNLEKSLNKNGIPVPSIAIVKKGMNFGNFGEITLIGDTSLGDPQSSKNKVFGADVYSPKYPNVETVFTKVSEERKFQNEILEATDKYLKRGYVDFDNLFKGYGDASADLMFMIERGIPFDTKDASKSVRDYFYNNKNALAESKIWLDEKLQDYDVKERIFDGFTPSGNRRYLPHNLDTVIKIMTRKVQDGEGYNYGVGNLRASVTKQFKTVKDLKANSDKLISSEEFSKIKDEVNDELIRISDAIKDQTVFDSSGYGFLDTTTDILKDYAKNKAKTIREDFKNLSPENEKLIDDYLAKLKNLPTEYFEAKPQRVVDIREFKAAVIPKNTSEELKTRLKTRGIKLYEYNSSSERSAMVEKAAMENDLYFQKSAEKFQPISKVQSEELVSKLTEAFPKLANVTTNLEAAIKRAKELGESISDLEFKNKDGNIYGFKLSDGTIYLNPNKTNANTTIHEFSHLLEQVMPMAWKKGLELFKQTSTGKKLYDQLKKEGNYSNLTDYQIWSEAMNTHIGNIGEKQYQNPKGFMQKFVDWFKTTMAKFLNAVGVKNTWTKETKLSEFTNTVLGDLLGGKEIKTEKNVQENSLEREKIKKAAQDSGTFMRAPNGEKTNLTEKQWLDVRSKEFKDKNGDWELAANVDLIEKSKPIKVQENSLSDNEIRTIYNSIGTGTNKYDNKVVRFVKTTFDKIIRNKGVDTRQLIPDLQKTFNESVPLIFEVENKLPGHKEHSNFTGYKHYVGKIELKGKEFYVRFTAQELKPSIKNGEKVGQSQVHNTAISNVEIYNNKSEPSVTTKDSSIGNDNKPAFVDTKLQQYFEKARNEREKSQLTFDNNGEPLAKYASNINFQIIGEKGAANLDKVEEATTRLDNLGIAREMETGNKSPKEIRLATGWEKGVDGKWKYEIADLKLKVTESKSSSLKNVIDAEDLFKSYPQLKDIDTIIEIKSYNNDTGSFTPYQDRGKDLFPITQEIKINAKSIEGAASVLGHEIQHAIQEIEGFAKGGRINSSLDSETINQISQVEKEIKNAIKLQESDEFAYEGRTLEQIIETAYDVPKKIKDWAINITKAGKSEINSFLKDTPFGQYQRLAGEVEARNVQSRANMSMEKRRAVLLSETEDVAKEDQTVLMDSLGVAESNAGINNIPAKILDDIISEIGEKGAADNSDSIQADPNIDFKPVKGRNVLLTFKEKWFSNQGGLMKPFMGLKDNAKGSINWELRIAKNTVFELAKEQKRLKFNSEGDNKIFDKALKGDMDSYNALPTEIKPFVTKMRNQIDGLSEYLVENNLVTPDQAFNINNNIGSYVTRGYEYFDGKKDTLRTVERVSKKFYRGIFRKEGLLRSEFDSAKWANAITVYQQNVLNDISADKKLGNGSKYGADFHNQSESEIQSYARTEGESKLMEYLQSLESDYQKQGSHQKADTSVLKRRQDVPEPIRKLLGEYVDPKVSFALTVSRMSQLAYQRKFMSQLKDLGMGTLFFNEGDPKKPGTHIVKIASDSNDAYAPLSGLYTTKEFKDVFLDIAEKNTNDIVRLWMKATGLVKVGKTVISPVTQMINFFANPGFLINNGTITDVKQLGASVKVFIDDMKGSKSINPIIKELIEENVIDQNIVFNEIESDFGENIERELIKGIRQNTAVRTGKEILSIPFKAYKASDDFYKAFTYYAEANRYAKAIFGKEYKNLVGDERMRIRKIASEVTKNTLPNYDRRYKGADFVRLNTGNLFGNFLSFQAESIRTKVNSVQIAIADLKNPETKSVGIQRMAGIMTYNAIYATVTSYLGHLTGMGLAGILGFFDDDEEDEKNKSFNQMVPDWARSTEKYVRAENDGTITFYTYGNANPYGILYKTMNAYKNGSENNKDGGLISMMDEFFNPFLGKEMSAQWAINTFLTEQNDWGVKLITWDDKKRYSMDKLLPTAFKVYKDNMDNNEKNNFDLYNAVGIKKYNFDPTEQLGYRFRDWQNKINDIGQKKYTLEIQLLNGKVKEEDAISQYENYTKEQVKITDEFKTVYESFIMWGADPDQYLDKAKRKFQMKRNSSQEFINYLNLPSDDLKSVNIDDKTRMIEQ